MVIIFILLIFYIVFSFVSFIIMTKRFNDNFLPFKWNLEKIIEPYKHLVKEGYEWMNYHDKEDVYAYSNDDLKLHGTLIENKKAKGVIILCHGYRGTKEHDLYSSSHQYYKMGLTILMIDERACAESEGDYITFGDLESKDLDIWIDYVNNRFKKKPIILGGISMGATTVLLSNNKLVKGIIADCPYLNAYDEINHSTKYFYHYSSRIFLPMINIFCKLIGNFDLSRVDVLKNIGRLDIPILFIHGLSDNFVPTVNSVKAYNYYTHEKELLLVEKADHGVSYLFDNERYIKTVKDFIDNIIK